MTRSAERVAGFAALLLVCLGTTADPVQLKEQPVTWAHFTVRPAHEAEWVAYVKKQAQPEFNKLRRQGVLLDWHLYVPGVHRPSSAWTHVFVFRWRDTEAYAVFHPKLEEALAGLGSGAAGEAATWTRVEKHFATVLYEIDLKADRAEEPRLVEHGEVFRLRPGEAVQLREPPVQITLKKITDSRCPGPPVRCTWAGEIGASLLLTDLTTREERPLYLGTITARRKRVVSLVVELVVLLPAGSADEVALKITSANPRPPEQNN
jgi:hypothetical protein